MTTASHGHAAAHDAAHDFDGEPVSELAADEPPTPAWLPSLGLALFLIGGVAYLTLGDDAQDAAARAAAAASASAAVAAAPSPPPQPLQAAQPAQAQPQAPPGIGNITPQQRADLQKRLDAMRARGAAAPPAPPHP